MIASLLVWASTIGRFGSGWLAGRMDKRYLFVIALLLQMIGLMILSMAQSFWHAVIFVLLFGPGYGCVVTLRLILQAEFFGRKAFGAIQGIVMAVAIIGTMSFPLLAGIYYDLVYEYHAVWLTMAVMLFLCLPFALKVGFPTNNDNQG